MSNVMPYPSSRYDHLDAAQRAAYGAAWRDHLQRQLDAFRPDVIHAHHAWLVSAMLKALAPGVPLVVHGHGTGLRQLAQCPHLAEGVRDGLARCDTMAVLHRDHATRYARAFGLSPARVHVVGAGYDDTLFAAGAEARVPWRLLYAGKLSAAKGLMPLLDAFAALRARRPQAELLLAGGGSGEEAAAIEARAQALDGVRLLGRLSQPALAAQMRQAAVFVLPSFYEGLPLVLVEALACGCRLVASDLPGVREELAPRLGDALQRVALPPMQDIDTPQPQALPAYAAQLAGALEQACAAPPMPADALTERLAPFRWQAVFNRVERLWHTLVGPSDQL